MANDEKRRGMIAKLEAATGRDLDAWIATLADCPHAKHAERMTWLKEEHGLGHFRARLVVSEAARRDGSA